MSEKKDNNGLKTFDVTTKQNGQMHFFTTATDHKTALLQMIMRSSDFRNCVKEDQNLTIEIKELT